VEIFYNKLLKTDQFRRDAAKLAALHSVMAEKKVRNRLIEVRFQCDCAFAVQTRGHIAVGDLTKIQV
jgi:hypothetical protein